jgi:hypothetical protein
MAGGYGRGTDPHQARIVTSSLGRPVETRQITIIPLKRVKGEGEPVVMAAWVVEESTWSKGKAPAIKSLRERFLMRPLIPMAHTARKLAVMDLVVGIPGTGAGSLPDGG